MITQLQLTLDHNMSKLSWTCVQKISWTGKAFITLIVIECDSFYYFSLRCLCHDGKTTEKAPFDILKTINCRPKKVRQVHILTRKSWIFSFQCKCNGSNKVKVVQEFGCEKGGYPICNKKEPGTFNLACKDGTRLTFPYIIQWNLDTLADQWRLGKDYKGCLCPDGIMPRFAQVQIQCLNYIFIHLFTDAEQQKSSLNVPMVTR